MINATRCTGTAIPRVWKRKLNGVIIAMHVTRARDYRWRRSRRAHTDQRCSMRRDQAAPAAQLGSHSALSRLLSRKCPRCGTLCPQHTVSSQRT